MTIGLFTLGAYLARNLSGGWGVAFWIASFVCLVAMDFTVRQSEQLTLGLLFGSGLLMGLAVTPTVSYFADVYPEAVWEAGGATAFFVAGFGAAGYATRRDLSALARVLLWALIALIAFCVVRIFVSIPGGSVVYAVFGLAVFAGLVMYDFQRLRVTQRDRQCAVEGSDRATDTPIPTIYGKESPHDDECERQCGCPCRRHRTDPRRVTALAAGTHGKLALLLGDDR